MGKRTLTPSALLFGPYKTPTCRKGAWINDELLGLVEVFGWTDGPLSWPRIRQQGPPAPVLTAELARAVRSESEQAVAYWWGVSIGLVQRWRQGLGVGRITVGTRQRLRENNAAMSAEQRAVCYAALVSPSARKHQAQGMAARRGKPAPEATRAALLRGARKAKTSEWGAKANAWMLAGKTRKPVTPAAKRGRPIPKQERDMRDSYWEDQADLLQHNLLYNLLKTGSHVELERFAGKAFAGLAGNTQSSVLAVLRARLERVDAAAVIAR